MSLDFSREQLSWRRDMHDRLSRIQTVLDTIPEAQNVQGYVDSKGKEGFRNPIRPVVGQGIKRIIETLEIKDGVELGTGLGRSGLTMALGGLEHLDTVEFDKEAAQIAQANFGKADVPFMVHNMDSGLFVAERDRPIGFLFIDHAKPRYLEDLVGLEPWLTPDALVLMDNTFNRAAECQDAVSYVADNYWCSIFTEPPTGEDRTTTGLLVASKDRRVFETAMACLLDARS